MSFRFPIACSLILTLSACGASSPSAAEGQAGGPGRGPAEPSAAQAADGKTAGPVSTEVPTGGDATKFVSVTSQTPEDASAAAGLPSADAADTPVNAAVPVEANAESDPSTDIVLLARAISELRTSIDSLREQNRRIMAAVGAIESKAEPQLTDPSQLALPADSLVDIVMDLRDTVAVLAAENATFGKLIQEQTTVLKPIPPTPTHGTLIVENNTDSDQYVWINGAGRWVWARTTSKVTVPAGELTTKLSGESQKTWEIKAPDYQEHIEFVRP